MLQAILKGKLSREEEDLEDLLTSCVFGTMKYVPIAVGILPLLQAAEDGMSQKPLVKISEIASIDYDFWPPLDEADCIACEPDILIRIATIESRRYIFLVESKYLSSKSSAATTDGNPTDQLAKEWDNLLSVSNREKREPFLIYITAHTEYPQSEIEDSIREYSLKRNKAMNVIWLSWRKLVKVFENTPNNMLKDLSAVLEKLGLTYY